MSFSPSSYGIANAAATGILTTAQAVCRFVETARQQRDRPARAAAAWQQMRIRVQRSIPPPGTRRRESLPPVEPAYVETAPYRRAMHEALQTAFESLRPLHAEIVAHFPASVPQLSTPAPGANGSTRLHDGSSRHPLTRLATRPWMMTSS